MRDLISKAVLALSARICDAVAKDEQAEGCDISAGLFGPAFSELVVELAGSTHRHVLWSTPEIRSLASDLNYDDYLLCHARCQSTGATLSRLGYAELGRVLNLELRESILPTPGNTSPVLTDNWRSIESAPKDGSLILLGLPETETTRAVSTPGFWQKGWADSADVMGCDDGFIDVNCQEFTPSRSFGDQAYRHSGCQPTRWQPLPAPPKA